MKNSSLRITEIFHSLQGESSFVGLPTTFVRLTGCPLRCVYCDTAYAFEGGERYSISDILDQVAKFPAKNLCITGGEPLAQPACLVLLDELIQQGYRVSLETSGAMDVSQVNPVVTKILDIKTPSSGEQDRNLWSNIPHLSDHDEVKFVIGTSDDFDWAVSKVIEKDLIARVKEVLFSPVHGQFELEQFAQKVLDTGMRIRMQLQLHKYVWNDAQGK